MPRAIGVDFGPGKLRICQIDGTPRKFRILRFLQVDYQPGETPDAQAEAVSDALRDAFREHRMKRDQVMGAIATSDCILRNISVPFRGDDQIRKVVRFEAESHLHSCSLDDVIVDYVKTGETGNKSHLLVFAGLKKRIRERLEIFADAGIDPLEIDLESVALFNTIRAAGLLNPEEGTLVIDVGPASTSIVLADGESLALLRSVRLDAPVAAGAPAVASDEEVPDGVADPEGEATPAKGVSTSDEAEVPLDEPVEREDVDGEWIIVDEDERTPEKGSPGAIGEAAQTADAAPEAGFAPVGPLTGDASPVQQRIIIEIRRCLATARTEREVSRVLLTGAGCRIEGLREGIQQGVGVPVELLDLAGRIQSAVPEEEMAEVSAVGGVALGLALKQIGVDALGLGFRKDDFRYQRAFEQVKIALSCCVSLIAILFLIILAFLLDRRRDVRDPWEALVQRSIELCSQVLPESTYDTGDLTLVRGMVRDVERLNKDFRKRFGVAGGGDYPALRSALSIWNDVFRGIHIARIDGFKLEQMDISQTKVRLQGTVPDSGYLETLQTSLGKASDLFRNTDTGTINPAGDGLFSFKNFVIDLPEEKLP